MILAVVVPFHNEERLLPAFLESMASQRRPPDHLLLVDDQSTDGSRHIAERFADDHPWGRVLVRPPCDVGTDRLAGAAELLAFLWAVERIPGPYDVVAKLDADLLLPPDLLAELEARFEGDPRLGMAGPHVANPAPHGARRLRCPRGHVQGMTKFYRRECLEQISPLPPILGWDTIDEVRARMRGWRTETFALPLGDVIHMRRMGSAAGILRGFRRAGMAAYGYGSSPLFVGLAGASRLRDRPPVLGGLNFLAGWLWAAATRRPRAERELWAVVRREQAERLRLVARRST